MKEALARIAEERKRRLLENEEQSMVHKGSPPLPSYLHFYVRQAARALSSTGGVKAPSKMQFNVHFDAMPL